MKSYRHPGRSESNQTTASWVDGQTWATNGWSLWNCNSPTSPATTSSYRLVHHHGGHEEEDKPFQRLLSRTDTKISATQPLFISLSGHGSIARKWVTDKRRWSRSWSFGEALMPNDITPNLALGQILDSKDCTWGTLPPTRPSQWQRGEGWGRLAQI
jgi:hypothetical protein